jgi:SAM-dependent methyltransferase
LELANRVGCLDDADDPLQWYLELGAASHGGLVAALPGDWMLERKRVLDFGCGAGRTLRHFVPHADKAEFWGCDIDEASVAWLREHLSPPLHVLRNAPEPPLEIEDETFDLVYAISVFTHLTDSWARWLAELHRVLVADGLLLVTFMGEGAIDWVSDESWIEERIGMNVSHCGQSWDRGGPMVLHSPWWIRARFGRALEILDVRPDGFDQPSGRGQGTVLMRKDDRTFTVEDLERPEPGEPREALALEYNRRRMFAEIAALRSDRDMLAGELSDTCAKARELEAELRSNEERLRAIASSRSWQTTAPLRRVAQRFRRAGSDPA